MTGGSYQNFEEAQETENKAGRTGDYQENKIKAINAD
jgi:hypothetical protein